MGSGDKGPQEVAQTEWVGGKLVPIFLRWDGQVIHGCHDVADMVQGCFGHPQSAPAITAGALTFRMFTAVAAIYAPSG